MKTKAKRIPPRGQRRADWKKWNREHPDAPVGFVAFAIPYAEKTAKDVPTKQLHAPAAAPGRFYAPNGKQEIARRLRNMQRG